MYGVVLIAVLAVMGGIIAYIGDKLGTKVGKRKLTIFGLRPKHTSILVTIVTGIMIATATLGVLTLVSNDVRTALFGMAALKNQLSSLSQEVAAKSTELEESRMALEAKTKEYGTLNAKVKETMDNLAKVTTELAAVTAERDRTAAALERVQAEYARAQGDLAANQKEIKSLEATKSELDGKVTSLDSQVTSLNAAKSNLQSDVDRLNQLTDNLRKGMMNVREGVVVFRAGEKISTAVVKGGVSAEEAKASLGKLIQATNADVLNKLDVSDKKLEVLWISQKDFDEAATQIQGTSGQVVVRISSAGNIVYGEPVIGRIELYNSRLIYSSGDTVYSSTVDGGHTAKNAEDAVVLFLQKLNSEAIKRGMLADPLQGTVGVISGSHLFDTINKVKHFGGQVELTAVAKEDIYTAGPLEIEIHVHPHFEPFEK
jgi:uncharacterized protein (DUF3084 family)